MRRLVQALGVILPNAYYKAFTGVILYQGSLKAFCAPVLNCYACPLAVSSCPIGSLQHFLVIRSFPFYLVGFLGIVGASVGTLTCGWLCPFGALQEMMYKVRSFKVKIPRPLRYLRYASLVLLVGLLPLITGEHWFSQLCPQGGLEAGVPLALFSSQIRALLGNLFILKLSILGGFLFLFIISKRPFCLTFCPLGAIFSLFNRFSLLHLRVRDGVCDECELCVDPCPAGIVPYREVDSKDCVRCWECVRRCPRGAIQPQMLKFWNFERSGSREPARPTIPLESKGDQAEGTQ